MRFDSQLLVLWLACALVGANLVGTWFGSSTAVHLTKLLRVLGWHQKDDAFWPPAATYNHWMRPEWEVWMILHFPGWLGKLLTCKWCLSNQVSLWLTLVVSLVSFRWELALLFPTIPPVLLWLTNLANPPRK